MNLKQREASTRRINERKRKHEDGTDGAQATNQPPKRVKNKEKYLPKGNKARKRAAAQLMNGANAIPIQERVREGAAADEGATPAAEATEGSKPAGEDFFMIDTTPMNPAEVAEKIKSKGQIKRERQAAQAAETHSAEWIAEKEARKEKKRKEARERKERNDKKKAQRRQEKIEKKQKKKEMKQQEESKKRKEKKAQEEKMDKEEKEKEEETSSSESDSDSDSSSDSSSSSGSDSEVEVKKAAPKVAEKQSEKKEKPAAKEVKEEEQATNKNRFIVFVGMYLLPPSNPTTVAKIDRKPSLHGNNGKRNSTLRQNRTHLRTRRNRQKGQRQMPWFWLRRI